MFFVHFTKSPVYPCPGRRLAPFIVMLLIPHHCHVFSIAHACCPCSSLYFFHCHAANLFCLCWLRFRLSISSKWLLFVFAPPCFLLPLAGLTPASLAAVSPLVHFGIIPKLFLTASTDLLSFFGARFVIACFDRQCMCFLPAFLGAVFSVAAHRSVYKQVSAYAAFLFILHLAPFRAGSVRVQLRRCVFCVIYYPSIGVTYFCHT